jgi:nucleotide-binding universal stress UspA family protein
MKSVLAAIDFSAGGKHVVAEAVTLARAIAARLVVLHVVQPPPVSDSDAGGLMSSQYAALAAESAAAALVRLQKKLQKNGITIQTARLVGFPGQRIVDCAHELRADYIVLGSHGHGALYDLIVGRTASHVLKYTSCPVVVVPQGPGRRAPRKVKPV